jgi:hypothetical protein
MNSSLLLAINNFESDSKMLESLNRKILILLRNAVFCDMMPCGSCKNRRFGRTYRLHHQSIFSQRDSVLDDANIPTSLILITLIMDSIRSSEASVPPKRLFLQVLLGVTSKKTAFFIVTSVKNSNLTYLSSYSIDVPAHASGDFICVQEDVLPDSMLLPLLKWWTFQKQGSWT